MIAAPAEGRRATREGARWRRSRSSTRISTCTTLMHPTLRYGWLERDAVASAPRSDLLDQAAAIRHRGLHRRDPLLERAEGDPRRGGGRHARPGRRDRMAAGDGRQVRLPAGHRRRVPPRSARMPKPCIERHMQYKNVRGIRDFGPGDYLVNPDWQRGFRLLGKHNLVSCVDTRPERSAKLAALAQKRARRDRLRRPLRLPAGARRRLFPDVAEGDEGARRGPDHPHEDLRPRHVRPALDGRQHPAVGHVLDRDLRYRSASSSAPTGRSTACSAPIRT